MTQLTNPFSVVRWMHLQHFDAVSLVLVSSSLALAKIQESKGE